MEEHPAIEERGARLHALTALRFFAAALIVVRHSEGYFGIFPTIASTIGCTLHGKIQRSVSIETLGNSIDNILEQV